MSGFIPGPSSSGSPGIVSLNVLSPAALAAGQTDNYAPTGFTGSIGLLRIQANAAGSQLSGLTAITLSAFAYAVFVCNIGPGDLTLLDESASSTAANRFAFPGDLILPAEASQGIWYDTTSSRWRLLS